MTTNMPVLRTIAFIFPRMLLGVMVAGGVIGAALGPLLIVWLTLEFPSFWPNTSVLDLPLSAMFGMYVGGFAFGSPAGVVSAVIVSTFVVLLHRVGQAQRLLARRWLSVFLFSPVAFMTAFPVFNGGFGAPNVLRPIPVLFSLAVAVEVGAVAGWTLAQYNEAYCRWQP